MTVEHKDLAAADSHIPFAYTQSGRPSSGTAADVSKLALDTDDYTIWVCTSHAGGSLTWRRTGLTASADGASADFTAPNDVTVTHDLTVSNDAAVTGNVTVTGEFVGGTRAMTIYCVEASESLTTGTGKAYLAIPTQINGANLTRAQAIVITAGVTGATTVTVYRIRAGATVEMICGDISIAST